MKMPEGPCLDCKFRTAEDPDKGTEDCHRKCEKYAQYKEELAVYKRELNRKRHTQKLGERPWMKHNGWRKDKGLEARHD